MGSQDCVTVQRYFADYKQSVLCLFDPRELRKTMSLFSRYGVQTMFVLPEKTPRISRQELCGIGNYSCFNDRFNVTQKDRVLRHLVVDSGIRYGDKEGEELLDYLDANFFGKIIVIFNKKEKYYFKYSDDKRFCFLKKPLSFIDLADAIDII